MQRPIHLITWTLKIYITPVLAMLLNVPNEDSIYKYLYRPTAKKILFPVCNHHFSSLYIELLPAMPRRLESLFDLLFLRVRHDNLRRRSIPFLIFGEPTPRKGDSTPGLYGS